MKLFKLRKICNFFDWNWFYFWFLLILEMALRGHPMYGRMTPDRNPEQLIYMSNMLHKFSQDYERRRRDDTQTTPEEGKLGNL